MNYKLYISPRSPFARRIRMVLEELGETYDVEVVSVLDAPPEFFHVNPLGRVPVLFTKTGEPLVESAQILAHLKNQHSAHPLFSMFGADAVTTLQISGLSVGVIELTVQYFLEKIRKPGTVDPEILDECNANIRRTLGSIEALLSDHPPSTPRLCDLDLAAAVGYVRLRLPADWVQSIEQLFPKIWKNFREMEKRTSFQKTVPPPA